MTARVYPLPDTRKRKAIELTDWFPGNAKPELPGLYLREFDEGDALSEFSDGEWLRDGFFPSDIQDARWRGLKAPAQLQAA
jgi:hypothetical protein